MNTMNMGPFVRISPLRLLNDALIVCVEVRDDEKRMEYERTRWIVFSGVPTLVAVLCGLYYMEWFYFPMAVFLLLVSYMGWRDVKRIVRLNGRAYSKDAVRADPRFAELVAFYEDYGRWNIGVRYELNPLLERLEGGLIPPEERPEVLRKLEAGRVRQAELLMRHARMEQLVRVAPLGSLPVDPSRLLTR